MTKYELMNLLKDCSITMNIPVLMFNERNKMIYHYPEHFQKPPKALRSIHKTYINECRKHPFTMQVYTDHYYQHLLLYPYVDENKKSLVIGIGPFVQQEVSHKHVRMNLIMNDLDAGLEEPFVEYLAQLPMLNQSQVSALKRLMNQLLPKQRKKVTGSMEQAKIHKQYQSFTQTLSSYPETIATKQKFFELFKNGQDEAIEVYEKLREKTLNGKDLRHHKNQMIRWISELGHVCMEKGAQQDEVDSLSDFYINFLESQGTEEDLKALEMNILKSFLERIQKNGERRMYSPLVERTQKYIFQNLTKDLTLKGIAEALNVNPNYLSGVFTKEKGISITQFINQQRIKEAKELLCITHHSLMDISTLLGYNSQSYFTRVFKSIEGIGPKEFRNKYRVYEE
ncbi:helix-turn-helix domain-containing protein [Halobacillus litoralis]|uniref:Helix-turn-helix domain-containing protein n=1 Tax=Halobacillus litoralis TaxID=45668 RepID=A0A845F6B8_9BACI|nr:MULTISPECIES: helix-turn-helix domain-containing protein [Halobacillus]MEC3884096.1 helix-turn-helix domain-containing protein [Halobacillus sp. HZG1]MYL69792.1 helix-turn-helix domain-containing protein [Halobacillus litoralis]